MALNLHQEAFVSHILAGKTAEAAYISAGYRTRSKEAARASGVRLAKHPEIQEALARARDEKARIHAEATKLAIERTGPVCPVVWEGRRREVPPYPDLG